MTDASDAPSRVDVLAFGDSLVAGYGLSPADAFPVRLEALLRGRRPGARVIAAGRSGDTSADGRARLPRTLAALERRPALAILELGANDVLRGRPPERMEADLSWMLEEFARCSISVLLAGLELPPLPAVPWAARYTAVFPALAARHGVALDPHFLHGVAGVPGLTLADGLHPNARAIGIVAARLLPIVERELARAGA